MPASASQDISTSFGPVAFSSSSPAMQKSFTLIKVRLLRSLYLPFSSDKRVELKPEERDML